MSEKKRILIIDDHNAMREGLELLMQRRGHKATAAAGGREGLDLLGEVGADLVITDLRMAHLDGIEVLRGVKEKSPDTDVLVITAHGTVEKAVEAMKLGACDFISKPFSSEEFAIKVDRILREREERAALAHENLALRVENTYLRSKTRKDQASYGEMVGRSAVIRKIKDFVARVAPTDSTVMVYGESGTGKELVARAIHARSGRYSRPFVRVNCGALAEGVLDSELFGHERGAFTGAAKQRRGRFELANGGTLFLDEIATVPPATQVRLLRVLQERELERVGGEETITVDVRIIAATNQPQDQLLSGTNFRDDLYYRLHVVPVTVPPLRQRTEDIPLLAEHFVKKLQARTRSEVKTIDEDALDRLVSYHWPGNVRELENVIERGLVLAEGDCLRRGDLPYLSNAADAPGVLDGSVDGVDLNRALEGLEERLIRNALTRTGGVKSETARFLKIKTSALYYKLDKYGIQA